MFIEAVFGHGISGVLACAGGILYSGGEDGLITTWDVTLVQATGTTMGHTGAIEALAINSDGTLLVSGGKDKILRVWSVTSGSLNPVLVWSTGSRSAV